MKFLSQLNPGSMKVKFSCLFVSVCALFSSCRQDESSSAFPGLHVPDGFSVEEAVPAGMVKYPMFATLDNRGRMFIAESSGETTSTEDVLENPTYFIRMLEDTDSDGVYDKSVIYADKIPYTMGGTFHQVYNARCARLFPSVVFLLLS